jgi:hypothetical protein
MRDRLVSSSPCDSTKLPKKRPVQVIPLTTATVHALANAVPERYRALVLLAAGTGLRQGECFGLDVDHIDLERRTLHVEQQLILLPGRDPFLGPPKTTASYRTIPLPDVVVDALHHHLEHFPTTHPEQLVFTNDEGKGIRRTWFSREIWRPAVAEAGARRGTGFHDSPTTTPRCSSATANPSRPSSTASGTPQPPKPSTPTPTCGPTPRTAHGRRSTPSSAQRTRHVLPKASVNPPERHRRGSRKDQRAERASGLGHSRHGE